ncbi:MAG: ATP synthase F1 subunit delta [Ignavibacteria bacterium]|nr:ATP synthase F1 subunit delta [Ignavibacteria bacterium]
MGSFKISDRYARAMMNIALERNELDLIYNDLTLVSNTIHSSREFYLLLISPVIKIPKKRELVTAILKDKISRTTQSFLDIVINKGRAEQLNEIINRFFELRNAHLGILEVEVHSFTELDSIQKSKIQTFLEDYTKKKIKMNFSIDKSLKGGFLIKLKETILDASLKRQFELLRNKFLSGAVNLN